MCVSIYAEHFPFSVLVVVARVWRSHWKSPVCCSTYDAYNDTVAGISRLHVCTLSDTLPAAAKHSRCHTLHRPYSLSCARNVCYDSFESQPHTDSICTRDARPYGLWTTTPANWAFTPSHTHTHNGRGLGCALLPPLQQISFSRRRFIVVLRMLFVLRLAFRSSSNIFRSHIVPFSAKFVFLVCFRWRFVHAIHTFIISWLIDVYHFCRRRNFKFYCVLCAKKKYYHLASLVFWSIRLNVVIVHSFVFRWLSRSLSVQFMRVNETIRCVAVILFVHFQW